MKDCNVFISLKSQFFDLSFLFLPSSNSFMIDSAPYLICIFRQEDDMRVANFIKPILYVHVQLHNQQIKEALI